MKRRNQIVHTLLTGVLIGGVATATVSSSVSGILAAEAVPGDEVQGEDSEEEDSSAEGTDSSTESGESGTSDPSGEGGGSTDSGTGSAGESGGSDGTESGTTESGNTNVESGTSSVDTGESTGSETESGTEVVEETSETDSSSDSSEQEESSESEPEEGTEEDDTSDSKSKKKKKKKSTSTDKTSLVVEVTEVEDGEETDEEDGAETGLEEEAERGALLSDAVDDLSAGEGDPDSEEETTSDGKSIAEVDAETLEEARKAAASRLAAERDELGIAGLYGFAYSDREYYSGSYFVTEAQKRLALCVGFEKIDKVYGKPKTGVTINIREDMSLDARVIGELDKDGICYILEDEEDSDWYYAESGEVRGYIHKTVLGQGEDVDAYVEEKGEENLPAADQLVDPLENQAYRKSLKTTKEINSILNALGEATVDRTAMIQFSMQFLGRPYVWGGDSLMNGCDCSGFTQQVYAEFGMSLPRCSYEQAEVGVKIPAEEALPGDLLFYARDGAVYHVLMYIGDGKAINASSSTTGIIISNVNYDKVCWACRFIADTTSDLGIDGEDMPLVQYGGTQASDLVAIGQMAYAGDEAAQQQIIEVLANAAQSEYASYGFARSVIIAQAIRESGWCSFPSTGAGVQAVDNNVLGMNADLNNSTWTSPWTGKEAIRLVPQNHGGEETYDFETMRLYEDIESCMEDYAAFKIGTHPELRGETDIKKVIAVGLKGYATDPAYQQAIEDLINKYDLTKYDRTEEETSDADDAETGAAADASENAAGADTASDSDASSDTSEDASAAETADVSDAEDGSSTEDDAEEEGEITDQEDALEAAEEADADETGDGSEDGAEGAEEADAEEADAEETAAEAEEASAETEDAVEVEDASEAEAAEEAEEVEYTEEIEEADAEDADAETGIEVVETAEAPEVFQAEKSRIEYGEGQLELIYAIVAEEDDTSYEGALAVISTAMNRADEDFGGYGQDALAQLTAEGQYRYSDLVDSTEHYKKRLKGNVPDYVKQAVEDCLNRGLRNTDCNSIVDETEADAVQIGANYYLYVETEIEE